MCVCAFGQGHFGNTVFFLSFSWILRHSIPPPQGGGLCEQFMMECPSWIMLSEKGETWAAFRECGVENGGKAGVRFRNSCS